MIVDWKAMYVGQQRDRRRGLTDAKIIILRKPDQGKSTRSERDQRPEIEKRKEEERKGSVNEGKRRQEEEDQVCERVGSE